VTKHHWRLSRIDRQLALVVLEHQASVSEGEAQFAALQDFSVLIAEDRKENLVA
jgi:hypothetical protein